MSVELAAGAGTAAAFAAQFACGASKAPGPLELVAMMVSHCADDAGSKAVAESTAIDRFEAELMNRPPIDLPLVHSFTPGIYMRQIFMPAGSSLTSRRHKTRHHFIILTGEIAVVSDNERIVYKAPYIGITEAGTRRALVAIKDTVWITIHANPEGMEDPDEIVGEITDEAENPLIEPGHERLQTWKNSTSIRLNFQDNPQIESPCR